MNFVCKSCRNTDHDKCPKGTWCDCQHRESTPKPGAGGAAGEVRLSWN